MGAGDWHVSRAKRHLEVAEFLADSDHHDWAAVALFYSAHQWVHAALADEATLIRDERHPRKHTSPGGPGSGGRGTTQLVAAMYPDIELAYKSLFDFSHRTRYDFQMLSQSTPDGTLWPLLMAQFRSVREFCLLRRKGRPKISTQAP